MTISKELREAYRFHFEHGGGIVGERARCALAAARAELQLREAVEADEARIVWEPEQDDPADSFDTIGIPELQAEVDAIRRGEIEWMYCRIERLVPAGEPCTACGRFDRGGWTTVASLGGIAFRHGDGYDRVVEAELAMEAFS